MFARLANPAYYKPLTGSSVTRAAKRLYHPKVIDHYTNPRNVGSMDKSLANVGTGDRGRPSMRGRDKTADPSER